MKENIYFEVWNKGKKLSEFSYICNDDQMQYYYALIWFWLERKMDRIKVFEFESLLEPDTIEMLYDTALK